MRRLIIWQYILIGLAWAVALAAIPLREGAKLNGFLMWRGDVNTRGLVQFLFALPRQIIRDWNDPTIHEGLRANGLVAATTFAYGDLAWLAAVLAGFLMFIFAPVIVRKRNEWSKTVQVVFRCFAPILLVFPATMFAPPVWGFPVPRVGMYLLGVAHVVMFGAIVLSQISEVPVRRFPVLPKAL